MFICEFYLNTFISLLLARVNIIKTLLEHNANENAKNKLQDTPRDIAILSGGTLKTQFER